MTKLLRYHLNLFLLATSFFSRLPVANCVQYSPSKMRRASQYFPLVGMLLATLLAGAYSVLMPLLGSAVSVVMILILSILLTGALHEDGLADTCDGIWGGYNTAKKLEIMKDSRIGTYGTCGLVLTLLVKSILWWELANHGHLVLAIFIAYPLSRALAITLVQDMPYVSNTIPTKGSKSEPLAKAMPLSPFIFMLVTGSLGAWLLPLNSIMCLMVGCISLRYWLKYWLNKHIAGYTGDTLGMAQQLQELLIYLILLATLIRIGV